MGPRTYCSSSNEPEIKEPRLFVVSSCCHYVIDTSDTTCPWCGEPCTVLYIERKRD